MKDSNQRILWIDCAKCIAIFAVVIDHSYDLLFDNITIARASYFSVTLFVLLSGISSFFSFQKKQRIPTFAETVVGLLPMLRNYAIATLLVYIINNKFFDLIGYLTSLFAFNAERSYYFILFFLQLKIATPFLMYWYRFCSGKKHKMKWHLESLLLILGLSCLCMRYTFILPVYGGGQFLLGGTYLFVYYLGIVLAGTGAFQTGMKAKVLMLLCSASLWIALFWNYITAKIPVDTWLEPYLGGGLNPPGMQLILIAICVAFFVYSLTSILESAKSLIFKYLLDILSFLGKNSLYVFLYHKAIANVLLTCLSGLQMNFWAVRFIVFSCMLGVAPVLACGVKKLLKLIVDPATLKR